MDYIVKPHRNKGPAIFHTDKYMVHEDGSVTAYDNPLARSNSYDEVRLDELVEGQQTRKPKEPYMGAEHYSNFSLLTANVGQASNRLIYALQGLQKHQRLLESSAEYRKADIEDFKEKDIRYSHIREFLQSWQYFREQFNAIDKEMQRYESLQ